MPDMKTSSKSELKTIKVIDSHENTESFGSIEEFALDILVGLSETAKTLPSKYFYDEEGSRLFTEITRLDEYYLTACERETLESNKEQIAYHFGSQPFNLIEFGSGDGQKTSLLLQHFLEKQLVFRYVPIDISHSAMIDLFDHLGQNFPELEAEGLVSEYFTGIKWLANHTKRKNLVIFLGSNIGNFSHAQARVFLRNLWSSLKNGDEVLIGFDLKKDIELLLSAYNDSKGVTSRFNLNILKRINRELGGQFDLSKFRHFGTYNVFNGAMESFLISLEDQEVFIEQIGRSFKFRAWEPIHVEYSYKYTEADIRNLALETGYSVKENFYDPKRYFIDSLWAVNKSEDGSKN
jgi:L-histidine N-alpha-methyltransferase